MYIVKDVTGQPISDVIGDYDEAMLFGQEYGNDFNVVDEETGEVVGDQDDLGW